MLRDPYCRDCGSPFKDRHGNFACACLDKRREAYRQAEMRRMLAQVEARKEHERVGAELGECPDDGSVCGECCSHDDADCYECPDCGMDMADAWAGAAEDMYGGDR